MAYQILATKLYSPPRQAHFVARATLLERLDQGLQQGKRLTLVSAPAGFGKSTLVSQWLSARMKDEGGRMKSPDSSFIPHPSSLAFGWLSLDAGDNDPVRFLVYLVAALQQADPSLGQAVLAALQSPQVPPLPELLEALINELAVAAGSLLLVLDDYHLVTSRDVHDLTQLLLERQPAALHTVIITREDPPLPLPRMRVRGQVTELRERELRFSQAEAAQFFQQTMQLCLTESSVAALERQTEGWVAGLQLAAIALQEEADEQRIARFIATFAGTDRYVADYLLSEVLLRQPEAVRSFLLQTSILERMCAPLCDAVLGIEHREVRIEQADLSHDHSSFSMLNSQSVLNELERANMFLIPLDSRREWYRYHHLFAELLHHTLVHMPKMEPAVLHRRASAWYEQQGFLLEAVGHAFKAQDWTFAAELLERHAMNLIGQSQVVLLHEWIEGIPAAVTQTRPGLSIFHAWVLMLTYRTDYRPLVCEKLAQAERALENQAHPPVAPVGQGGACVPLREWVLGQASALRSQLQLAAFNEPLDPYELISLGQQGLALLPDVECTIRSTCAGTVALAYLMLGEVAQARQGLIETMQLAEEAGNQFGVANMHFYLSRVAYLTGDHDRALALCAEGLARLRPRFANPEQEFPAIRSLYVMQGVILLERDQLAEAQQLLELATNRVGYAPWVELIAYAALVRLWERRDEPANVSAVLSRMVALGPQIAACGEALRFQHLTRQLPLEGHVRDAATQWTATYVPDLTTSLVVNGIGPYQVDAEYIVLTAWLEVQLALGNLQAALEAVTPILTVAEAKGFVQRVRELAPIRAVALQACAVAAPAPPAAADHPRSVGAPAPPGARQPDAQAVLPPAVPPAPLDALSERELEVLRLLAQGLTLAEVAERLVLSPYTVKAHTQNIYAKLDAHSRVEAINQARVRGLIV